MGGRYETQLCVAIIEELFGKAVALVAENVMKEPSSLAPLAHKLKSKLTLAMIRKSLSTLINFGMVSFSLDNNMKTFYTANTDVILRVLTAPRNCYVVKTLYGEAAEAIYMEIFTQGQLTFSETLRRAFSHDDNWEIEQLKVKFCELAAAQFIKREPAIEYVMHNCPQFVSTNDPFAVPPVILTNLVKKDENGDEKTSRKRKANDDADEGVYWRINWPRFDIYARDELLVDFLVDNVSTEGNTAEICKLTVRALLKANELRSSSIRVTSTTPISMQDMMKCVKEHGMNVEKADIEYSLRLLSDESNGVLRKAGDSAGGLYLIDIERAIREICKKHCESLVREQFESRAVRILRLLEQRHFLDEDQVEKLTMMSSKETRELLYALVEEGYIFTKPIGRSNDFQPARTFYLYHVDLPRTVRGLVEYTCKLIRNLIVRNAHERKENKHLIDKEMTIGPIVEGIKANEELDEETKNAQIEEVKEMYLPGPDRAALDKYRHAHKLLLAAQDKSARVLFAFELFLDFSTKKC